MSVVSGLAACASSNVALPTIDRLSFQSLQAELITGHSTTLPGLGHWVGHDELNTTDLSFCNVSLTYTHDGHTEPINTHVYLPLAEKWNERMVGIGGGGWAAGLFELSNKQMVGAVSEGYIAVSTDAGGDPWNPDPENWALHKDGTVNMYLIENLAHRTLRDMASIGKAISQSFYGALPKYSYWNGCSQGGRQGYMLAQEYPDAFDGILAFAPALNLPSMLVSNYWTHHVMNLLGEYPHQCELEALRTAAIAECDHEDGIQDGIIANPDACLALFNPFDLIGTMALCPVDKAKINISEAAAKVAEAAWTGPRMSNGSVLWHGHSPETDLVGDLGKARTMCNNDKCDASDPHTFGTPFIKHLVRRGINLKSMRSREYESIFSEAKIRYDHLLASDNPDLFKFRDKGGKLLSIHGQADEIIPHTGTRKYYESVLERDPSAQDYFRYFEAPGVGHCFGGAGPIPTTSFADLVAWVEQGRVPDTLLGTAAPNTNGEVIRRPLCAYPLIARYTGTGDSNDPSNFYCAEEYLSATPISLVIARAKKFFGFKSEFQLEV